MMTREFTFLEAVVKRAPLGLRFRDLSYAMNVTDGLRVTATELGKAMSPLVAERSPVSGIFGFYSLPGLKRYEENLEPASNWCQPNSSPNWVISIEDRLGRFLPQVLPLCLPKEQEVRIELYSSPARTPRAGYAIIRGELWDRTTDAPAGWALVTVTDHLGHEYVGVADGRGVFVVLMPYPNPIDDNDRDNQNQTPLNDREWPITFQVFYEPSIWGWSGKPEPVPVSGESIEEAKARIPVDSNLLVNQAPARIFDTSYRATMTLTRPLRYRTELLLKTHWEKHLWVDPM